MPDGPRGYHDLTLIVRKPAAGCEKGVAAEGDEAELTQIQPNYALRVRREEVDVRAVGRMAEQYVTTAGAAEGAGEGVVIDALDAVILAYVRHTVTRWPHPTLQLRFVR